MASEVTINFVCDWVESETDLSKCAVCAEPIYSKMYTMEILFCQTPYQNVKMEVDPPVVVCAACCDAIKSESCA